MSIVTYMHILIATAVVPVVEYQFRITVWKLRMLEEVKRQRERAKTLEWAAVQRDA